MMNGYKRYHRWYTLLLFAVLTLSLQSCLGMDTDKGNTDFQLTKGASLKVNMNDQAAFKGKIYFTLDHNLYALDSTHTLRQLTSKMDVRDPAVSPDGKWIAFIVRYKDYSDLVYMSSADASLHTVVTGNGQYFPSGDGSNDFYWFAQPTWSQDSSHLLFLSDLHKMFYWQRLGGVFRNAYFSDLQVFSLPIGQGMLTAKQALDAAQPIAYADFGDGGDRDAIYRPGHSDQVVYTHYTYDTDGTGQIIQLFLEDPNAIANNPGKYMPGVEGSGADPAVAITPRDKNIAALEPAFSPDGNTLAYIQRQDTNHQGLYTMPVVENVTQDPNNPDHSAQAMGIYKKSTQIVSGQYISQPVWSPDGKELAYMTYTNNVFDIWLAKVAPDPKQGTYKIQGAPVQLTSAEGHLDGDSRPCWQA